MSHRSEPALLVLTGLRLTSVAPAARVAAVTGLDEPLVAAQLEALASEGLVRRRGGDAGGWQLTPAGRLAGEQRLAAELEASGARAVLERAYARFLELNPRLLAALTTWQVREVDDRPVPNDHTDADHDATALAALVSVDDEVQPVLADLAGILERFAGYGPRLDEARRRIEAGDHDWVDRPMIDSYHSVWFELHEHLLASLGIDRATEADRRVAS